MSHATRCPDRSLEIFLEKFLEVPSHAFVVVVVLLAGAACEKPELTVDVLPPRTSISCAAPGANEPALSSGVFDLGVVDRGVGYRADLRFTLPAADARVEGIRIDFSSTDQELHEVVSDKGDEISTGGVSLVGDGDDIRTAILENVSLLTAAVADDILDDDVGADITQRQRLPLGIDIKPLLREDGISVSSAHFSLELCHGCLVDAPSDDVCPYGSVFNTSLCRPGQDLASYSCLAAPANGG